MNPDRNRLLLVDDDRNNLAILSRPLLRQGYSVEVAEDGPAALKKIFEDPYDLVLLDQLMPGMSGIDLLRLLRATYSPTELPIIMVSAVEQSEIIEEALEQGANDCVEKPVNMRIVTARIEAQLLRSKTDRKLRLSDSLTGLSNRLHLLDCMATVLHRPRCSPPACAAALLLDLDGFKVVNDSFGHGTGDLLLVEIAKRLRTVVGRLRLDRECVVARIGGDEFAIFIENLPDIGHLENLAEAILSCIIQPVCIQGFQIPVSASLGVVVSQEHSTPETLLRDADSAMYYAKQHGKNQWRIFELALRERAQVRMAMAIDLRQAVQRGEFFAVYQPKIDLPTGAVSGFEALLRWRHPERGLLNPADFIPVAEETGLIVPIGDWILAHACRQIKRWQRQFPSEPPLSINVNLSVNQLMDPNLIGRVKSILRETGIPPESLKLELTESALMTEIDSAQSVLTDLRELGVALKLDDFGTGYSSLNYLRTFHFDALKIDRSFVKCVATDPESSAIVAAIVGMAHALDMTVVAEGIEDQAQLTELRRLGCDTGQGYFFSVPLEASAAELFLEIARKQPEDLRSTAPCWP